MLDTKTIAVLLVGAGVWSVSLTLLPALGKLFLLLCCLLHPQYEGFCLVFLCLSCFVLFGCCLLEACSFLEETEGVWICTSVHRMNAWCLREPGEGVRSLRLKSQMLLRCPLEEQPVFLTAEPSTHSAVCLLQDGYIVKGFLLQKTIHLVRHCKCV